MNRVLLLSIASMFTVTMYGQITLEQCQIEARNNYPLIKQLELIEESTNYSVSNAAKAYLPQVALSAQATYQSDVAAFSDKMAAVYQQMGIQMKGLNKDQYKTAMEINQIVWDGGATRAQKKIAQADGTVSGKSLEVELYPLRERINQLYFGILILQEQLKQNTLLEEQLQSNLETIEAYIQNGVAQASDANAVKVELLAAAQQKVQLKSTREAYILMLALFMGEASVGTDALFEKPAMETVLDTLFERPEYNLLDARNSSVEAQKKALHASVMPRFGLFAQGFYGNPGLNLFKDMSEDKWTWNYVAGVRMQWGLGSLYTLKGNSKKLSIAQKQIENQREIFQFNQNLNSTQQRKAIDKMQMIMADDQEIIDLRTSIRHTSEAKYAQGTITVNELLRDIFAENQSVQSKAIHEIECLKQVYDLKYTLNSK